jgi:8-oxo-dGTP diphosphatase
MESAIDSIAEKFADKNDGDIHVAAIAIISKGNKILMGKRLSGPKTGLYGLPGGHIEFGETSLDACARELKEETNLEVEGLKKITFSDAVIEGEHFVSVFFGVEVGDDVEPENPEPDAHESWEWFDKDDLPSPRFEDLDDIIEEYFNG